MRLSVCVCMWCSERECAVLSVHNLVGALSGGDDVETLDRERQYGGGCAVGDCAACHEPVNGVGGD